MASNLAKTTLIVLGILCCGVTSWSQTPTPTCNNTWTATSNINAPIARSGHTGVWTGSELIVWGGYAPLINNMNTGGRYNPSTDSWTNTSTINAPAVRASHRAVWTGSEMIVWGGVDRNDYLNTGGRYNPATDTWTAISTINAPSARYSHTVVWTGSEMIVWGGYFGDSSSSYWLDTGGRYNPATNTWTATSVTNAPVARSVHTAIWTGSEMIIWGGFLDDGSNYWLNTGGRYNPVTDSWTATSTANAPANRVHHSAIWTDSEMIVWGGDNATIGYFNTGSRYNPDTDSWTATNIINAPIARNFHTAVWTGYEMIIWGGHRGFTSTDAFSTGGRYNPRTNSWIATTWIGAPLARAYQTGIWTGSEMIVWGGWTGTTYLNTGGRYCAQPPPTPAATPTATPGHSIWPIGTPGPIGPPLPDGTPDPYREKRLLHLQP